MMGIKHTANEVKIDQLVFKLGGWLETGNLLQANPHFLKEQARSANTALQEQLIRRIKQQALKLGKFL